MIDKYIQDFRKDNGNVFYGKGYKWSEEHELRKIYNRLYNSIDAELNNNLEDEETKHNLVNVFIPTTPNPTSGFLLMFPKDDVIYLDTSFEEASKFIVSAGTSNPKN